MGIREFTKSGKFVAIVFALLLVSLPFGLEEIGETTTLFSFPAKETVSRWFKTSNKAGGASAVPVKVDWERCKRDLEEFNIWAESCRPVAITMPQESPVMRVIEEVVKPVRKMWAVPVTSCSSSASKVHKKPYIFIAGISHAFEEGAVIAPSESLCGYEIFFIGERTVWFRPIFDDDDYDSLGPVKIPKSLEFTRVESEALVRGRARYGERDAFALSSGGYLMIDSFLPPDAVIFKFLDEHRTVVASVLCVVISDKGGK